MTWEREEEWVKMHDRDASHITQRKRTHTRTRITPPHLTPPTPTQRHHRLASPLALLALPLVFLLALAACSPSQPGQSSATQPPASTAVATGTAHPAGTPSPTPIAITDLNTFRQKLSTAFSTNTWSNVAPLLSPNFSFAGTDTNASQLVMPASAHDMQQLYASQGPWTQASQYEVDIHECIAGPTPKEQQIGFDGGGGSFILIGIGRWQSYWVVAWAFQDPLGGYDACAHE
jgi:hypothetical protein